VVDVVDLVFHARHHSIDPQPNYPVSQVHVSVDGYGPIPGIVSGTCDLPAEPNIKAPERTLARKRLSWPEPENKIASIRVVVETAADLVLRQRQNMTPVGYETMIYQYHFADHPANVRRLIDVVIHAPKTWNGGA
jgi:hypothetical protein